MSLIARACPDPQFIEPGGRVLADVVTICSADGEELAGELVLRKHSAFPMPTRLDEAVEALGFRRSGAWHRCAGDVGDEWVAEAVSKACRSGLSSRDVRAS